MNHVCHLFTLIWIGINLAHKQKYCCISNLARIKRLDLRTLESGYGTVQGYKRAASKNPANLLNWGVDISTNIFNESSFL
jgi:hypothetical protein